MAIKHKGLHAACSSAVPKLHLSQNLKENWGKTMDALLCLCYVCACRTQRCRDAPFGLTHCRSSSTVWVRATQGCPTRQCSRISRTFCSVELADAFSSMVYKMYGISEKQHVLFVFLSLQRPDQWTCCINQRNCCPLEYVQWSCVCALLQYICFAINFFCLLPNEN